MVQWLATGRINTGEGSSQAMRTDILKTKPSSDLANFARKNITSIQFKKAGGLTNGYIQFSILGGLEATGGIFNAVKDENTVAFKASQEVDFREVSNYLEGVISS